MTSCLLWGVLGWWGYKNSASFESVEIGIEMLVFVVGCDLCEWKKVKKRLGHFFLFSFYFILFCHILVVVLQLASTTL